MEMKRRTALRYFLVTYDGPSGVTLDLGQDAPPPPPASGSAQHQNGETMASIRDIERDIKKSGASHKTQRLAMRLARELHRGGNYVDAAYRDTRDLVLDGGCDYVVTIRTIDD